MFSDSKLKASRGMRTGAAADKMSRAGAAEPEMSPVTRECMRKTK